MEKVMELVETAKVEVVHQEPEQVPEKGGGLRSLVPIAFGALVLFVTRSVARRAPAEVPFTILDEEGNLIYIHTGDRDGNRDGNIDLHGVRGI